MNRLVLLGVGGLTLAALMGLPADGVLGEARLAAVTAGDGDVIYPDYYCAWEIGGQRCKDCLDVVSQYGYYYFCSDDRRTGNCVEQTARCCGSYHGPCKPPCFFCTGQNCQEGCFQVTSPQVYIPNPCKSFDPTPGVGCVDPDYSPPNNP